MNQLKRGFNRKTGEEHSGRKLTKRKKAGWQKPKNLWSWTKGGERGNCIVLIRGGAQKTTHRKGEGRAGRVRGRVFEKGRGRLGVTLRLKNMGKGREGKMEIKPNLAGSWRRGKTREKKPR